MRHIHASIVIVPVLIGILAIAGGVRAEVFGTGEPGDVSRGAQTWAENCGRCHNLRGPTEYRDDLWKPVVTHMRVIAGLTGQQARDVLAFLQEANAPGGAVFTAAAGVPEAIGDGRPIYEKTCVACHGADGKGAIPGVPDLRERLAKPDGILLRSITEGYQSPGSPMAMPAKGGDLALTDADIRVVLAYIRQAFGRQ